MRRMYSEQELSVIVYQVMGQYIKNGAFNQTIDDYIDAYLVEHPVDPTAITGLDIAPKNVTASGNIAAPSIIENMSGYSFTKFTPSALAYNYNYVGIVKNGNKITLVVYLTATPNQNINIGVGLPLGTFNIPSSIGEKLFPSTIAGISNVLMYKYDNIIKVSDGSSVGAKMQVIKTSNTQIQIQMQNLAQLDNSVAYNLRLEATFLLSENLTPQE